MKSTFKGFLSDYDDPDYYKIIEPSKYKLKTTQGVDDRDQAFLDSLRRLYGLNDTSNQPQVIHSPKEPDYALFTPTKWVRSGTRNSVVSESDKSDTTATLAMFSTCEPSPDLFIQTSSKRSPSPLKCPSPMSPIHAATSADDDFFDLKRTNQSSNRRKTFPLMSERPIVNSSDDEKPHVDIVDLTEDASQKHELLSKSYQSDVFSLDASYMDTFDVPEVRTTNRNSPRLASSKASSFISEKVQSFIQLDSQEARRYTYSAIDSIGKRKERNVIDDIIDDSDEDNTLAGSSKVILVDDGFDDSDDTGPSSSPLVHLHDVEDKYLAQFATEKQSSSTKKPKKPRPFRGRYYKKRKK